MKVKFSTSMSYRPCFNYQVFHWFLSCAISRTLSSPSIRSKPVVNPIVFQRSVMEECEIQIELRFYYDIWKCSSAV